MELFTDVGQWPIRTLILVFRHAADMHTTENNPGKVTWGEWHRFREEARETAHSPEEFSPQERTRFNLDSDDAVSPAGVTGQFHEDLDDGDDVGPGDRPPLRLREDPTR